MSKKRKIQSQPLLLADSAEKKSTAKKQKTFLKIGLIIGILLLVTIGFGAIVNLRNSNPVNPVAENLVSSRSSSLALQPLPTPQYEANQPVKEYVYAGGKLLAVSEPVRPAPTDLAVWRLSTGTWYVMSETGTFTGQQWGASTDLPAPGDYDGDGKTDFCVFRPDSVGVWYVILTGSNNAFTTYNFGTNGDKPVPGDYDGDGKTDIAVYRPSNHTWYVFKIGSGLFAELQYGISGDVTVPGDYDGDGKADYAMWRNSDGTWHIWQSGSNFELTVQWGVTGDKLVPGDYDGDGKTDAAVWRNDNKWYIRQSSNGNLMSDFWGVQASDIAVQGDYDADGKTDIAVWRPSNGTWYIRKSSTETMRAQQFGQDGDIPVPAPYRR